MLRVAQPFVLLVALASTSALSAQTVADPRHVGFAPTPDHDTLARGGTPLVQQYSPSLLPTGYASRTFTASQAEACTFTLSPPSQSVAGSGGSGSTTVIAPSGCAWTSANNTPTWLTITGGATGTGNGTVTFTAFSNPTALPRSGILTIAGQTFTVNQEGASCDYTLTPTSQTVLATGGTGSAGVTAMAGCPWTAVSNNTSWLTITGGTSGNGDGMVTFSAAANTQTQARSGTLTIAGQTFTVNQNAAGCLYSISPTSQSVPMMGGNVSTTVTTSTGCNWTTVNTVPWITVTDGAGGSSSGSASFTVAPSTSTAQRTGTLTIAGRTFTVTQAANACSYVLTPTSRTLTGAGGSGTIAVEAASGCPWAATTTQSWIIVSGSGTASGSASYTVQSNTTGASRIGAISIGTQVFTILQSTGGGAAPIAPTGLRVVVIGGGE